jgi:hypothetical protein
MIQAANKAIFQLVTIAMLSLGFAQVSTAGIISSGDLANAEARSERISRVEIWLARDDVAEQLIQFGVSPALVAARVQNMTDAELLLLENRIEQSVAGADAVGIIGAVFLVLIILELVGVTDIFKAF